MTKAAAGIGSSHDELSTTEHTTNQLEFSVNCWGQRELLPKPGTLRLDDDCLVFNSNETEIIFSYQEISIERASRMGGRVHDAFKITSRKLGDDKDVEYLFTTILKDRKLVFDKLQHAIREAEAHPKKKVVVKQKKKEPPFEMPPDDTLEQMIIIGKEKLRGVTMQDYYEVAWSEGENSTKPPLYAPFLTSCGKDNIVVSHWEEKPCSDWCEQSYTHQRLINFNFMKQTIGLTLVEVKHTQRLYRDNDDRCIVHISMEMKGFPYADCFVVEVRHVASRHGKKDLIIEVGMHVRFLKSCLFEGKIRNNTGSETSNAQVELLKRICEGCKEYALETEEESHDGEAEEESHDNEVEEDNHHDEDNEQENSKVVPLSNGTAAVPISRSTELTEANNSILQTVLLALASLFQKYVQPYVPYSYKPIQPTSVDETLKVIRSQIDVLKDVSVKSVKEEDQEEVKKEILAIEKRLENIEKIAVCSKIGGCK